MDAEQHEEDEEDLSFRESRKDPQLSRDIMRRGSQAEEGRSESTNHQVTHTSCCFPMFSCMRFGRTRTARSASNVVNAVEVFLFRNNEGGTEVSPAPQLPPMKTRKRLRLKPCTNSLGSVDAVAIVPRSSERETDQSANPTFLPGWKRIVDERTGHVYYHDEASGKSLWEAPCWEDEELRKEPVEDVELVDQGGEDGDIEAEPTLEDKGVTTCSTDLRVEAIEIEEKSKNGFEAKSEAREKQHTADVEVGFESDEEWRRRRRSRSASPKFSYVKEISQFYGRNDVELG